LRRGFIRGVTISHDKKSKTPSIKKGEFNVQAFLDSAGVARRVKAFKRAETIYSQGDPAASVMYLQEGGVKLSVLSEAGKEAVVAILGPGDFFGEGCLAGHSIRMGTATAITPSTVLLIEKREMFKGFTSSIPSPTGSSLSCCKGISGSRRT
jgi:CRP-like cAMP-binding protein